MMDKLKSFQYHYALLAGFTLAILVHAGDQSGFISIDCGKPEGSFTEGGIVYLSDKNWTDTGIPRTISSEFNINDLEGPFSDVTSFPQGTRNCYFFTPDQGKEGRYLIRARFMYGNYDGQSSPPQFDLYLGDILWQTVKLENASSIFTTEIIHLPSRDYIFVCLFNTGHGTPFISSLELRPLNSSLYQTQSPSESLVLLERNDFGSETETPVRYMDDVFDRIWMPRNNPNFKTLSSPISEENKTQYSGSDFQVPFSVMRTAITPSNVSDVGLAFSREYFTDPNLQYYVYLYFAEVEVLDNQIREFFVFDENLQNFYGPFSPRYLHTVIICTTPQGNIKIGIIKTNDSDLQPIINAIEVYMVKESSQSQTHQDDVGAMMNLKSTYQVKRNSWQGDPCFPEEYRWDGVNCSSYEGNNPLRIISLNLSSSGLTGEIAPFFANLKSLQYLDLSYNRLSGPVPAFLSRLPLTVLDLRGNYFTGSIPAELMERSKNQSLILRISSKKEKNEVLVPVIASLAALLALLIIALAILCSYKVMKKRGRVETLTTEIYLTPSIKS